MYLIRTGSCSSLHRFNEYNDNIVPFRKSRVHFISNHCVIYENIYFKTELGNKTKSVYKLIDEYITL